MADLCSKLWRSESAERKEPYDTFCQCIRPSDHKDQCECRCQPHYELRWEYVDGGAKRL